MQLFVAVVNGQSKSTEGSGLGRNTKYLEKDGLKDEAVKQSKGSKKSKQQTDKVKTKSEAARRFINFS